MTLYSTAEWLQHVYPLFQDLHNKTKSEETNGGANPTPPSPKGIVVDNQCRGQDDINSSRKDRSQQSRFKFVLRQHWCRKKKDMNTTKSPRPNKKSYNIL